MDNVPMRSIIYTIMISHRSSLNIERGKVLWKPVCIALFCTTKKKRNSKILKSKMGDIEDLWDLHPLKLKGVFLWFI